MEPTMVGGTSPNARRSSCEGKSTKNCRSTLEMREELRRAQKRQKKIADKKRDPAPSFGRGEMVWLSRRHVKTRRPCEKLDRKYLGPFKVACEAGPAAYKLILPSTMRIHNVFHVSLLRKVTVNEWHDLPAPEDYVVDGEEGYEVEEVLECRPRRGRPKKGYEDSRLEFRIRWKGWGEENVTWEPEWNLTYAQEELQDLKAKTKNALS